MREHRPPNRRRGIRPRFQGYAPEPPPDEWCAFCKQPPWEDDRFGERSCIPFDVRGVPRVRHGWPDEVVWDPNDPLPADTPCKCGAPVGGYHHWPCDIETCPHAEEHPDEGYQLMCCGCLLDLELP